MGLFASSLGTLQASHGLGNPLKVREAKLSLVYPLQPHWTDSQSQSQSNSRASEVSIQFSCPLSPSPTPQPKLPSLSVQRAEQAALQGPCSGNRLNGVGSHNQPGTRLKQGPAQHDSGTGTWPRTADPTQLFLEFLGWTTPSFGQLDVFPNPTWSEPCTTVAVSSRNRRMAQTTAYMRPLAATSTDNREGWGRRLQS